MVIATGDFKKKDGSNWNCVGYRKVKVVTKFDVYPTARIDEILGNTKYITALDLAKGYWQVLMVQENKEETVFSSLLGLSLVYNDAVRT